MQAINTATQAKLFAHYLIRKEVSKPVSQLYTRAVKQGTLSDRDHKLLTYMGKHPVAIGFIDAGLVFSDPYSEVRRRLYVMLAILEASPEYTSSFLPKNRGLLYLPYLAFCGCRAVVRALFGILLIRIIAA